MPQDMSRYLALFVSESTEHLEALGQDLVHLEKARDLQVVDSIFRHAHSVKGMAASMGFEPIAVVAHRVEDLVDALRADGSLLDQRVVDLLLAASDHLLEQVRAAGQGQPLSGGTTLIAGLTEALAALTGRPPEPTRVANVVVSQEPLAALVPAADPSPEAARRVEGGALGLPPRLAVKLKLAPSCRVPGVRAFLIHKRLSGLGNLFNLRPPLEDLKAGRIPDGLISLELETTGGQDGVRGVLANVPEVELVALRQMELSTAPMTPSQEPEADGPRPVGHEPARTVRVRTELLDYFLDTVGELLLATARIREVAKTVPASCRPPLEEGVDRLHGLVKDLHDKVMGARMTPLAVIMDRLPRVARDVARRRDREVDLVITGAEIELDRAIVDELTDPLIHLLRNCIDHGIEGPAERAAAQKGPRGRVLISVRRQRDRVILELEDDGRGMDPPKLRAVAVARGLLTQQMADRMTDREAFLLACMPGVSTASDVSEISGRGVGMDAVKRTVESVGGTLEIESEPHRGTRFTLRLPLTVAVVNLLLVGVGEEIFGLPITKVLGALEMDEAALSRSRQDPMLAWDNGLVPVYELGTLLGVPAPPRIGQRPYVVMESDGGRLALAVDRLVGQEEVVLKALSRPLDRVSGLSGVTILGSGRPVFILDVPRLVAA
jgi:two-component system, chemotaxis family, sensor kinase CheA